MNYKIDLITFKATIKELNGKKEVVSLEKLYLEDYTEGFSDEGTEILNEKVKNITNYNRGKKSIKLSNHKVGDMFSITLKILRSADN